jgi:hypothetical protein
MSRQIHCSRRTRIPISAIPELGIHVLLSNDSLQSGSVRPSTRSLPRANFSHRRRSGRFPQSVHRRAHPAQQPVALHSDSAHSERAWGSVCHMNANSRHGNAQMKDLNTFKPRWTIFLHMIPSFHADTGDNPPGRQTLATAGAWLYGQAAIFDLCSLRKIVLLRFQDERRIF